MITLSVPNMTCGHCKASVEAALKPLSTGVSVDLAARRVALDGPVDVAAALAALNSIGFPSERVST